jgi:putative hydrolase of the HAD superfamily
MIKAIVFDFGQTLVDSANGFRSAEKDAQNRIFSDLRMASWDGFLSQYRKIRKAFYQSSRFSRKAIWEAVYIHFEHELNTKHLTLWETEYWKRVQTETTPFPETVYVLETLSKDHQLALVTNTQGQKTEGSHRISLFPELEKFFEIIIVAGEGRVPPKPDPVPFTLCLKQLGVAPSEAVFVGDDWRIDICGAGDVGIQPIWLRHRSVGRNWPDVETTVPIIESLNDLLDLGRLLSHCCTH